MLRPSAMSKRFTLAVLALTALVAYLIGAVSSTDISAPVAAGAVGAARAVVGFAAVAAMAVVAAGVVVGAAAGAVVGFAGSAVGSLHV